MAIRNSLLCTSALCFAILAAPIFSGTAQAAIGLNGHVSSVKEGMMEGVIVSARKDGSTITTSVVTDNTGGFAFPSDRLSPGHYTIKIRATGYDRVGAEGADLAKDKQSSLDIKLSETKDISTQVNNAEWLASVSGSDVQKRALYSTCVYCHTLDRIFQSKHSPDEFVQIFQRMRGYYSGSMPEKPQLLPKGIDRPSMEPEAAKATAEFLAANNLSKSDTHNFKFQVLPRAKGKATHVVITEYALPRPTIEPHDVIVAKDGIAWYSDFGALVLGKMDPKTGKVTEYAIPEGKNKGHPKGTLDLEEDAEGNLWVALMWQGTVTKFDRKTEKFRTWDLPDDLHKGPTQFGFVAVNSMGVDGKVWLKNNRGDDLYRLDPATGKFEYFGLPKNPHTDKGLRAYGILADSKNNAYLLELSGNHIGRQDAKSKNVTAFSTETPKSGPRRGRIDSHDRVWFAEFGGNGIGMFDPATGEVKEWPISTKWSAPYDVAYDESGYAWAGSMMTDRVARLDVKTGQYVEYPLPEISTNIRRMFVDNTKKPGTVWIGSNHSGIILKVEPQD